MINLIKNILPWFSNSNTVKKDPFDSKRVTADISLMPICSNNVSTKKEVRKAVEIISRQGFKEVNPHAFGTNVTGNWSDIKEVVSKISKTLLNDVPRLQLDLKLSFRRDKAENKQTINSSLASVK